MKTAGKTFTEKEKAAIEKYIVAFRENFKFDPVFYKCPDGAIIIYPNETELKKPEGEYIQFCENISYCAGWLYGTVCQRNKHFETWIDGRRPD